MVNNELFTEKTLAVLQYLGILPDGSDVRNYNEGTSDYNDGLHIITPWAIWLDYPELTSFDHDIIKRVLRTKKSDTLTADEMRVLDYKKIIHVCQERIRQIEIAAKIKKDSAEFDKPKK